MKVLEKKNYEKPMTYASATPYEVAEAYLCADSGLHAVVDDEELGTTNNNDEEPDEPTGAKIYSSIEEWTDSICKWSFAMIGMLFITTHLMAQDNPGSLVPTTRSTAPDYYCTWNLQGFVTSYAGGSGSNDLRMELHEDNLFGSEYGYKVWGKDVSKSTRNNANPRVEVTWTVPSKYQGWLNHFPSIQGDLTFVMDDSWDLPNGKDGTNNDGYTAEQYKDFGSSKRPYGTNYDNPYLAYVAPDASRFPSFTGTEQERLTALVNAVKAKGWRSLGGWVCAQDPIQLTHQYMGTANTRENSLNWSDEKREQYWGARMTMAEQAGFDYWKVDWGNKDRDTNWRQKLSTWQKTYAPNLVVEHARMSAGSNAQWAAIPFSDTWRTYDVLNHYAQAQTLTCLKRAFTYTATTGKGIINAEDEAYIAAALGCAIGIMRTPYVGNLPKPGIKYPANRYFQEFEAPADRNRQLNHRLNEIVRAVRWHRIAEPFGVNNDMSIDDTQLTENATDAAHYAAGDAEAVVNQGNLSTTGPARMSRNMVLPEIKDYGGKDNEGNASTAANRPFVLGSVYPNGCAAVATINRNIDDKYQSQRVDVTAYPKSWDKKVGIFGLYNTLTLEYTDGLPAGNFKVYAQDLASDEEPTMLSYYKTDTGKGITINGSDIEALCGYVVETVNGVSNIGHNTGSHAYAYDEVRSIEGLEDKDYTDLSDPAIVLLIVETTDSETGEVASDTQKLEAENAKKVEETTGNITIGRSNIPEGGVRVMNMCAGNKLNFTFTLPHAGTYTVKLHASTNNDIRTLDISANYDYDNKQRVTVSTANFNKFMDVAKDFFFTTGVNTIQLFADDRTNTPHVDYITIQPKEESTSTAADHYLPLPETATNTSYLVKSANARDAILERSEFVDGKWNTLILPCSLSKEQFQTAFGEEVQIAEFQSVDENKLHFAKKDLTAIKSKENVLTAGAPYLVKVTTGARSITNTMKTEVGDNTLTAGNTYYKLLGVTFGNASSTTPSAVEKSGRVINNEQKKVRMTGTYVYRGKGGNDKVSGKTYTLNSGILTYYSNPYSLRAFRCWIEDEAEEVAGAKAAYYILDDISESATGIVIPRTDAQRIKNGTFSIDGKRIDDQALPPGIYIRNGKKVSVRQSIP